MKEILNQEKKLVEISDEQFDAMSAAEREANRDALLLEWQASKDALEKAKEREMQLRVASVHFIGDPNKQKGTERVELGNGYEAKMVKKLNFSFIKNSEGKVDRKAIERALTKIEKDGAAGELIAERLVKWNPDLSLTEYNQLSDKYKKIIDEVIVTSEGAPTLDIIPPKNK